MRAPASCFSETKDNETNSHRVRNAAIRRGSYMWELQDGEVRRHGSSGKVVTFRVPLPAALLPGPFSDTMVIRLSEPQAVTERVAVSGNCTGQPEAFLSRLFTDQVGEDNWRDLSLEATVRQRDGKAFAISEAQAADDGFAVAIEPAGRVDSRRHEFHSAYKLRAKLPKPFPGAFARTVVRLEADVVQDSAIKTELSDDIILDIPAFFFRSLLQPPMAQPPR